MKMLERMRWWVLEFRCWWVCRQIKAKVWPTLSPEDRVYLKSREQFRSAIFDVGYQLARVQPPDGHGGRDRLVAAYFRLVIRAHRLLDYLLEFDGPLPGDDLEAWGNTEDPEEAQLLDREATTKALTQVEQILRQLPDW